MLFLADCCCEFSGFEGVRASRWLTEAYLAVR